MSCQLDIFFLSFYSPCHHSFCILLCRSIFHNLPMPLLICMDPTLLSFLHKAVLFVSLCTSSKVPHAVLCWFYCFTHVLTDIISLVMFVPPETSFLSLHVSCICMCVLLKLLLSIFVSHSIGISISLLYSSLPPIMTLSLHLPLLIH